MKDLIKNARRQTTESYIPNWLRLNKEPLPLDLKSRSQAQPRNMLMPQPSSTSLVESRPVLKRASQPSEEDLKRPLSFEEVPDLPEQAPSQMLEAELEPNQFGIVIGGDFLFKSFDITEIESTIEQILLTSEVLLDDISLIHRLPIKMGVVAITQ